MAALDSDGFPDSDGSVTATANYLRAVSLAIAFYDYLLTLPAEYRFYRSQRSWRLSPGCILFIAIRYSSIAVLLLSNIGYFANFFDAGSCHQYFIAAPVLKVVQTTVSQIILGIRTMNISRRSTWVTWAVGSAFLVCTFAEWFLNLWNRVPVQSIHNNCTAGNKPPVLTVWLFYVLAMTYDLLTLGISTIYLVNFGSNAGKMARLVRIMLTDGLIYFIALTGVNIFNLILYRNSNESVQSSGVSLGYAVTWIMSQRILIHLRDAAAAHNRTVTTQIVVSRALPSPYSVSQAMRSQFESKDRHPVSTGFDLDWSYTSHQQHQQRDGRSGSRGGPPDDVERSFASLSLSRIESRKSKSKMRAGGSRAAVRDVQSRSSGEGSHVASRSGGAGGNDVFRDQEREYDRGADVDAEDAEDADYDDGASEFAVSVEVKIEETVTVEVDADAFERETYREPRVLWTPASSSARGGGGGDRSVSSRGAGS